MRSRSSSCLCQEGFSPHTGPLQEVRTLLTPTIGPSVHQRGLTDEKPKRARYSTLELRQIARETFHVNLRSTALLQVSFLKPSGLVYEETVPVRDFRDPRSRFSRALSSPRALSGDTCVQVIDAPRAANRAQSAPLACRTGQKGATAKLSSKAQGSSRCHCRLAD